MQKKLAWLAAQVVISERRGDADPDKKFINSVSLSAQETQMMARLQSTTGRTRAQIFRAGLALVYKHYFS